MNAPVLNFPELPAALASALSTLLGTRFSTGMADREQHGRGESYHATMPPQAVCRVQSTEEVAAIVRLCAEHRVPIIPFGAGTSLEGHVTAPHGGICLDLAAMNAILAVRPEDLDATIEAGVTRQQLNAFLREGPTISGAWLGVDGAQLAGLFERFKGIPRVAGVAERVQEIRAFNRVMDETMLFFTYVATVFAVVIAFGVIYNSARIALTERGRELASLRVLGFTRGEIAYILLGELAVLTLAAIPLGLLAGRWMCHYIASTMQNDLFRVPVVLAPQTYAFAVTVVLVSALLSGLAVRSRLDKLDLVAVLKTPE